MAPRSMDDANVFGVLCDLQTRNAFAQHSADPLTQVKASQNGLQGEFSPALQPARRTESEKLAQILERSRVGNPNRCCKNVSQAIPLEKPEVPHSGQMTTEIGLDEHEWIIKLRMVQLLAVTKS